MAQCAHCGKHTQTGNHVSHSKHRTKRWFHANVHSVRLNEDGRTKRVYLCTKCIKALSKV